MAKLSFPDIETTGEPKELRDFKKDLVRVAKVYKKRYGMCDVVDSALRELGVELIPKTARVSVYVSDSEEPIHLSVDPHDLIGLSEDEQKGHLADLISSSLKFTGPVVKGPLPKVYLEEITKMELTTDETTAGANIDGFNWLYANHIRGRVLHAFRDTTQRYVWSECGRTPQSEASESSLMATGARCIKCSEIVNRARDNG